MKIRFWTAFYYQNNFYKKIVLLKLVKKMKKMAGSIISKPEQFHHENKTWERSLEFFKQENTFLKVRLSEVLDHKTNKDFLALAEQFQNQFILKDEYIDELRHDVREQEQMLKEHFILLKPELENKLVKKQVRLRNEMEYLEKDFTHLRNEFNKYLASVL